MHARIRKAAALVLLVLQLEACFRRGLPPEDYGITVVISSQRDAGAQEMNGSARLSRME